VAARGKPFARFSDDEWMCGFTSVVDITIHLKELNTCLQDKAQLINSVFCHIRIFKIKLHLWLS